MANPDLLERKVRSLVIRAFEVTLDFFALEEVDFVDFEVMDKEGKWIKERGTMAP